MIESASLAVLLLLVLVLGAVVVYVWRKPRLLDPPLVGPASATATGTLPSQPPPPAATVDPAPPATLLLEPRPAPPQAQDVITADVGAAHPIDQDAAQEVGADFYTEVVGLLEAELARNAQRDDLRLKLLEVYAATERTEDFIKLAAVHLQELRDGRADPSWTSVVEMGRRLAPEAPLFAPESGAPDEPLRVVELRRARRYYENVDAAALKRLSGELNQAWQAARQDIGFWTRLREMALDFVGAPPPLLHATKLSSFVGGAQILVRNEAQRPESDATVIAALGQVLLAQSLGSGRVVASPADAAHALSVARAAQQLGLEAELIVTHDEQTERAEELAQARACGARVEIVPGRSGRNEGQRAALARALEQGHGALFISPLAAGPFPYPVIVRELQGLTGLELKSQMQTAIGRLPDAVLVSASDGMPAIGVVQAFLGFPDVALFCVEAGAGSGSRRHRLGREHNWLRASGRVHYSSVPTEVARFAAQYCMPDGSHSVLQLGGGELLVETFTVARQFSPQQVVVVILPSEPSVTVD